MLDRGAAARVGSEQRIVGPAHLSLPLDVGLHLARPAEHLLQDRLHEAVLRLCLVPRVYLSGHRLVPLAHLLESRVRLLPQRLHVVALRKARLQVVVGEEAVVVDRGVEERRSGHRRLEPYRAGGIGTRCASKIAVGDRASTVAALTPLFGRQGEPAVPQRQEAQQVVEGVGKNRRPQRPV